MKDVSSLQIDQGFNTGKLRQKGGEEVDMKELAFYFLFWIACNCMVVLKEVFYLCSVQIKVWTVLLAKLYRHLYIWARFLVKYFKPKFLHI